MNKFKRKLSCLKCGKEIWIYGHVLARGGNRGRFCSRGCACSYAHKGKPKPKSIENAFKLGKANVGRVPWNKKELISKDCLICGKTFLVLPYRLESARFCSRQCSHKGKTLVTGLDHPLFSKKLISCDQCGKEYYEKPAKLKYYDHHFCSRRCAGSYGHSLYPRETSIEAKLRAELERRDIAFFQEKRLGAFIVDFYLPEMKSIIEADGDYWHRRSSQIERDQRKDGWLGEQGFTVYRFWESDIKRNPGACIDQLFS